MNRLRFLGACAAAVLAVTGGQTAAQPRVRAQGQPPAGQAAGRDPQQLHDALRLNPAQEDAWRAFQGAMASRPEEDARLRGAEEMMPRLSAPRRADLSLALMQSQIVVMRRRADAVKAFYGVLSPQQQALFDRLTAPPPPQTQGQ